MSNPPKVFISYSHETPEHKKWVADFASKLMENGVEVILDQWDLEYGDDVPKFMEKSLQSVDRVLMICTEDYVTRANDGLGGVGYEAMIVTSELVANIGTKKFIPVVRQKGTLQTVPTSVSTRLRVNLTLDDKNEFEKLLRELHKAPPSSKPKLGNSPYAQTPSGIELPISDILSKKLTHTADPSKIYEIAKDIVRSGDISKWRQLIRTSKVSIDENLTKWRVKYESQPAQNEAELITQSTDGINCFAPIMALALAGVGSGREKFANQLSIFHEILNPNGWNRGGYVNVVELPYAAAFVFQSLYGALCLYTNQVDQAMIMVRSSIRFPQSNELSQIWREHQVMGWPSCLGGNSKTSWEFLETLPEIYPWITTVFGDKEDYLTALTAYYMLLNINEYCYLLKDNQVSLLDKETIRLDIPLSFEGSSIETRDKAYILIRENADQVRNIWRSLQIYEPQFTQHWDKWVAHCNYWIMERRPYRRTGITHGNILNDL